MSRSIRFICFLFLLLPLFLFAQGEKMGRVTEAVLSEISGIVPYSYDKGYFWVHNDSGDKAQIYLINSKAKLETTVELEGVRVVDCEDIARLTLGGVPYLFLADIGNNLRDRSVVSLYLFPEPQIELGVHKAIIPKKDIEKLDIRYSDKSRDAEAIFVDPIDQEVYIISKRDFRSTIFSFPLGKHRNKEEVIDLSPKGELPFTFVTSADISKNGKYILVKNLTDIYLWNRVGDTSIITTLSQPFKKIPYTIEPQGEAVCFDLDDACFYTISERPLGLDSYLLKYTY